MLYLLAHLDVHVALYPDFYLEALEAHSREDISHFVGSFLKSFVFTLSLKTFTLVFFSFTLVLVGWFFYDEI